MRVTKPPLHLTAGKGGRSGTMDRQSKDPAAGELIRS